MADREHVRILAPLRLTLAEAKALRACYMGEHIPADELGSASRKLDALIVALDERLTTLPPPPTEPIAREICSACLGTGFVIR